MWPAASFPAELVARKQQHRESALQTATPYDAVQHGAYLEASASEIVRHIERGEWTAVVVLEAYIARAAFAHRTTNCLTEVMFETARARAKSLDVDFARTGKLLGPLHGVPISIKDHFEVVGYDTSMGFTQWTDEPAESNAEAVDLLLDAGAVPFVKTNIPQTLLAYGCSNPLWGRTTHPLSADYTSGGSSGGEAALLALSGAVFGLGSDVAGSLRIPSGFCGVFTLKPGHGRVPCGGVRSSFGSDCIRTVVGPLSRSMEDLVLACRILFGAPDKAGEVAPIPYRDVKLPQKLKIGYYTDDGYVKASPANARAVREAVQAFRRQGHECIELDWPFASDPVRIYSALESADGYRTLFGPLGPDPLEDSLFLLRLVPRLPGWMRSLMSWAATTLMADQQFGDIVKEGRAKTVQEVYELQKQRSLMNHRFHAEIWDKFNIDGIISPVQALPAVPHHAGGDLCTMANANMQYNVVDCPTGVVPVTHVDPALDNLPPNFWAKDQRHSIILSKACERVYDPAKMAGLPVGIQLAGRKWEDEKVLAMMQVLDEALGHRSTSSRPQK